jgi:hypothetical protein
MWQNVVPEEFTDLIFPTPDTKRATTGTLSPIDYTKVDVQENRFRDEFLDV